MTVGFFDSLILILLAAVIAIVVCRRLRVPPTVAYIFIGMLVGSDALGWIPNVEATHTIAKFGVVFLMFTIGLEFSLTKLITMRRVVFGLGTAQVVLTTVITTFLGHWLGMTLQQALIVGCIVAMSSTAIVSKQLVDQNELGSPHGQNAIAILLFQDLAVIPFFILIGSFSFGAHALNITMLMALGKTVLAIATILGIGYWLLRPLFREIVVSESLELFTLSVLLVTLSAAWLTYKLDLSLALGGFVAGMMLGETEFRHQIEATIRPFRDLLMGLFFITVGMLFEFQHIAVIWPWVLLLLTALTLFKVVLISALTYLMSRNMDVSLRTGLILAQGGEFGFALLTLAMSDKLLPDLYGQVVLGALVFSMALAPLMIRFNDLIVRGLLPARYQSEAELAFLDADVFAKKLKDHVIICGFSRVGQNIAQVLDEEGISYLAIDLDHQRVISCQESGRPVIYGDASLYDMLCACKIRHAKALVVTFDIPLMAEKIVEQVRTHHKHLPIFVRTHDDSEFEMMQKAGATEVIPTSLEISLTMAAHVLLEMGVSGQKVSRMVKKARANKYRMLRPIISEDDFLDE